MDQLLDEAVDEATSASPRRWVLLLVLVVGGIVAVWLSKRARRTGSTSRPRPRSPPPADAGAR